MKKYIILIVIICLCFIIGAKSDNINQSKQMILVFESPVGLITNVSPLLRQGYRITNLTNQCISGDIYHGSIKTQIIVILEK